MNQTNYTVRFYIDKRVSNVIARVRWMGKKRETTFPVECKADAEKWDPIQQRAKMNTTHVFMRESYSAYLINRKIEECLEIIRVSFARFDLEKEVPTVPELRAMFHEIKEVKSPTKKTVNKTLEELYTDFLNICSDERNWTDKVHYKYQQMWRQLTSSDPNLTLESLTKERMINLKNWYVSNNYRNVTITKQFKILKSFLRWIKSEGYDIAPGVIDYKVNLTVVPKTVTYLSYQELIDFMNFKYPEEKKYLAKARDYFCFMSFTSLRYSDLKSLKKSSVHDDYIEVCTQKTSDSLRIPLVEQAKAILATYWDDNHSDGLLFHVPANQKLNQFLKEAAKLAGLDKPLTQTYFIGTKRFDKTVKFYEQMSCHCARRTFVCCSLALGIPPTVVMSCTGHKDYESMKPYIEVADETQQQQMTKWNVKSLKSNITQMLDQLPHDKLVELWKDISLNTITED